MIRRLTSVPFWQCASRPQDHTCQAHTCGIKDNIYIQPCLFPQEQVLIQGVQVLQNWAYQWLRHSQKLGLTHPFAVNSVQGTFMISQPWLDLFIYIFKSAFF